VHSSLEEKTKGQKKEKELGFPLIALLALCFPLPFLLHLPES
jgi:hypothetical protein